MSWVTVTRSVACITTMCIGIFCLIRIPYTLYNSAIDAIFVDTSLCSVRCGRPEKNQIMLGRDNKVVQVQNMNVLFSRKFDCADVGNFWGHLELC
jgi:hypothetical protein